MTDNLLQPGKVLADGLYTVVEFYKRGGMAEIYKVQKNDNKQQYALKIISLECFNTPEDHERFILEVDILKQLNHPNLMKIEYVGKVESQGKELPYYIMKFYSDNLAELIQKSLDIPSGLSIVMSALKGLEHAHEMAIYHRDLKPSNILIDEDNKAVLTDLGIAKTTMKQITKKYALKGTVLGTAEYMSPEQIKNTTITPASDIYSIGCILYETCTGEIPFRGANYIETMRFHLEKNPVPPKFLNPLISSRLEEVILKCLQKNPEARYKSVKELTTALRSTDEVMYYIDKIFQGGEIIAEGSLEIIDLFAKGGVAEIYKTKEIKTGKIFALKIISLISANDPYLVDRFINEIQITEKLDHPNIVHPVFSEYYEIHGKSVPYFVMPFFQRNLASEIKSLSLLQGLSCLVDVAVALEFSNMKGILHRDVKPSNVLIDDDGRGYLTDFGIAKINKVSGVTTGRFAVGTCGYMSPEQIKSEKVDLRSDIYSFGIMLFELVAGTLPFTGSSDIEIISKHVSEKPPLPKKLNPNISNSLQQIILKCIEKSPDARYQTFSDLLNDLKNEYNEEIKRAQKAVKLAQIKDKYKEKIKKLKSVKPVYIIAAILIPIILFFALTLPPFILYNQTKNITVEKYKDYPNFIKIVDTIDGEKGVAGFLNFPKNYRLRAQIRTADEEFSSLIKLLENRKDFPKEYFDYEALPSISKNDVIQIYEKANAIVSNQTVSGEIDLKKTLEDFNKIVPVFWKTADIIRIDSPKSSVTVFVDIKKSEIEKIIAAQRIKLNCLLAKSFIKDFYVLLTMDKENPDWSKAAVVKANDEKKIEEEIVVPAIKISKDTREQKLFNILIKPKHPTNPSWKTDDFIEASFSFMINTIEPKIYLNASEKTITVTNANDTGVTDFEFELQDMTNKRIDEFSYDKKAIKPGVYQILQLPKKEGEYTVCVRTKNNEYLYTVNTALISFTPTPSASPTLTPTPTKVQITPTPKILTPTPIIIKATITPTLSPSPTSTLTPSPTAEATITPAGKTTTPTPTPTPKKATPTPSPSPSPKPSPSPTETPRPTPTTPPTPSPTDTPEPTPEITPTPTAPPTPIQAISENEARNFVTTILQNTAAKNEAKLKEAFISASAYNGSPIKSLLDYFGKPLNYAKWTDRMSAMSVEKSKDKVKVSVQKLRAPTSEGGLTDQFVISFTFTIVRNESGNIKIEKVD